MSTEETDVVGEGEWPSIALMLLVAEGEMIWRPFVIVCVTSSKLLYHALRLVIYFSQSAVIA